MKGSNLDKKKGLMAGAVVYALLLFVLVTCWRLPADRWLGYLVERITQGRVGFKAARVAPAFPLGYRFEKVSYTISQGGDPISGQLAALIVKVDFLKLFAAYFPITFRAFPPSGGEIDGKAGISAFRGVNNGFFSMKASGASLDGLGLGGLLNRGVKGILSGEMAVEGHLSDPSRLAGQGVFLLQKGSVDTQLDFAGLKAIPFERMQLPFSLREGLLSIEKAELVGPMLSGTVVGHVRMNKPLGRSALDLTARFKPGPALEGNPTAGPLLARIRKAGDQIVLKLGGVIANPSMTWGGN
ncbi:MAG: type II secretion system protein GspN [Thermodesulfobacteriota bacterium]